jgi:outer membrane lipoprotein-sorting protein
MTMTNVLVLLIGLLTMGVQQDDYAKKILDEMSDKYQEIPAYKANFSYTLENKVEGVEETFNGDILVKGEKYHLKLSDQEIYNNGETLWTYFRDANEVNIDYYTPNEGDMSPNNIYNAYKNGYRYRFIEEERSGSKVYNVIELQPEDPNDRDKMFYKVVLNIDKTSDLIDHWKMYDRAGNVYTYRIKGFNPSVNATAANFEFSTAKYPGVEVVDLR